MYRPVPYREDDCATLLAMIHEQSFATLVSSTEGAPLATHLPLIADSDADGARLIGHMARANPHWRQLADGQPVLAVFLGPHAYVSPRWYPDEPDVPTWNYAAVHVHARWRRVRDWAGTRALLERSVRHYEDAMRSPWSIAELEEKLVTMLQKGVVAFELPIQSLEGVRKMGQDKSHSDVKGVVTGLRNDAGAGQHRDDVATAMESIAAEKREP